MYRVLIVSDSHGLKSELKEIRKRHKDIDLALHCGDSELTIDDASLLGYHVVKGNCDWQANFPEELVHQTGGLAFYITHGHLFNVKNSLEPLQRRAAEKQANIVCFGHSHIAFVENIAGTLFINPGSIRMPRENPEPTYAILEWEDENPQVSVQFYEVNGELPPSFPTAGEYVLK